MRKTGGAGEACVLCGKVNISGLFESLPRRKGKKKNPATVATQQLQGFSPGDPAGIRTPDPLLKRQLLCRLSYRVVVGRDPASQIPPFGRVPFRFDPSAPPHEICRPWGGTLCAASLDRLRSAVPRPFVPREGGDRARGGARPLEERRELPSGGGFAARRGRSGMGAFWAGRDGWTRTSA